MKILIVRVGAMGDVLHALPAVSALRRVRQDWEIDWVVTPHWSPLLVDGVGKGPVVRRVHLGLGAACGVQRSARGYGCEVLQDETRTQG